MLVPWVKVFRIIPELRILRLTFRRMSASKYCFRRIIMASLSIISLSKDSLRSPRGVVDKRYAL